MLRLVTFNLKYASDSGPNPWPERRPLVRDLLARIAPDLLGTQEGLYRQLREIAADLPAYDWIGAGRDGGSRGEFMAIFYRRDRLEPQEFDHFWLSDTPDVVGSSTWGNNNRRMVTWVRFRDRQSGADLYHANTHFDFAEEWHLRAVDLLQERLSRLDPALPLLLTGDFNAAGESALAYRRLTERDAFRDTWTAAATRGPDGTTFHDWGGPRPGARIDWILVRGPVRCDAARIVTEGAREGRWPSDHFPVQADLLF